VKIETTTFGVSNKEWGYAMMGTVGEKSGWIYVSVERPPDWKLPTFFPLVDAMFKEIKSAFESQPRKIVFDMSRLEYIDSTMMSLFLQTVQMTGTEDNAIITTSKHTHDILGLLGIDKLFRLCSSIDEWIKAGGQTTLD
jgi:anti-anti-sigma factor